MSLVEKAMAQDTFCMETVGIQLLEVAPGRAKAKLQIDDRHLNGLGIIQGGAIFTLADLTLAAASNSHGNIAVLVNANITYFKALTQGTLMAEATEEAINPKLATYRISVTAENGEPIALMQATVYRKKETLDTIIKS